MNVDGRLGKPVSECDAAADVMTWPESSGLNWTLFGLRLTYARPMEPEFSSSFVRTTTEAPGLVELLLLVVGATLTCLCYLQEVQVQTLLPHRN